jgi:hypothetical protein
MPRPTATATPEPEAPVAEVAETEDAPAEQPEKKRRKRREIPEGVTIGLTGLKPVESLPPVTRGKGSGRGIDPATLETIKGLKENPNQWFEIGTYSNCTPPKGAWEDNGIEFTHRRREDGFFTRIARYVPSEVEATEAE